MPLYKTSLVRGIYKVDESLPLLKLKHISFLGGWEERGMIPGSLTEVKRNRTRTYNFHIKHNLSLTFIIHFKIQIRKRAEKPTNDTYSDG